MKLLHTSDWHIGKLLHKKKRYEEFEQFFAWLETVLRTEQIDALLVAGDIFDTTTPSNRSQELYYSFLSRIAGTSCRHVVITAGNHDSPTLLNAPRDVLRHLNIHVVGCVSETIDDEVLVLRDRRGDPELIVCAVPYLRDADVRTADDGETPDDKTNKTLDGIRRHYGQVVEKAEDIRRELKGNIPVVAMGHLFAAGGETTEGDGVRDLYIGNLASVTADVFPPTLGYVALGHLHKPQKMNHSETRRYCGSPLPMGFGEAQQQKYVVIIDTDTDPWSVRPVGIPCFQKLMQLRGTWSSITAQLKELNRTGVPHWLEIVYDGADIAGSLQEHIDAAVMNTNHTVLAAIDMRRTQAMTAGLDAALSLDEMTEEDLFMRCLESKEIADEHRPALMETFREALMDLKNGDHNAG
ncbi:MAG: exonuclease SbcCD subunit D C-terminal domain-containing protein [Acidobacteriota bacterium]